MIQRDFLRGYCDRLRCRFRHERNGPDKNSADMNTPTPVVLNFCHDYQNNNCPRPNCRFIHCTPAEEELYKRTGELPLHLQADAIRKHQLAFGSQPPVCKNFLNGDCRRGSCKYRHITRQEHETEIRRTLKLQGPEDQDTFDRNEVPTSRIAENALNTMSRQRLVHYITDLRRNGSNYNTFDEYGPPDVKRCFFPQNKIEFVENNSYENDLETRTINRINNIFNGNPQPNQFISRIDPRILLLDKQKEL